MRVIVSAGGTGGHIFPALAIMNKIKEEEPNSEFLYIGTHNRMEKDIVPKRNIPYVGIEIYGFNKRNLLKNFKTISCLKKAYKKCKEEMIKFKPDIVIGVGGYVTVPVILAAHSLKIPTFIHEQNSLVGKSNMFLSKKVDKIGVSFKSSMEKLPKNKVVFTGNPCSDEAINIKSADKRFYNLNENKKLVLVVMGSLGSNKITDYMLSIMDKIKTKDYEMVLVTGKNDYDRVKNENIPSNVHIYPFIDNLTSLMKRVDVMVSRAGASTISEIVALKVPTIFIPSPYVANNHQYLNALDLEKKEAAILIEEKNLTGDILINKIDYLLNEENAKKIKNNLEPLFIKDSSYKIYKTLKEIIDRK